MSKTIEIGQLSREEKLRVMEALWEDLSREDEQVKLHLTGMIRCSRRQTMGEIKACYKNPIKHWLIKKTKQPQRNFLSDSGLDTNYCQVRIRDIYYLFETFVSAPNFPVGRCTA